MLAGHRYRGRHRKPSTTGRAAARVAVAGVALAGPVALASPASAAPDSVWDRLAQCESSGRWDYNGSSGYDGGLQFSLRTWTGFGGGEFARYAYQASRTEQIVVAERVLAAQGWGAWPACSRKLGIRGEPVTRRASAPAAPQRAAEGAPRKATTGTYTVRAGDTLAEIAAAHGTTWRALYAANRKVVEDPERIYPGERLAL